MKKLILAFFALAVILVAQSGHSVTLTWVPSAVDATHDAPTSYNVLRGLSSGAESTTPIGTVAASTCNSTACTYVDSTVTAGTTYFYEVTASNGTATSGPSKEVSVTVPSFPPNIPGTPTATAK